MKLRILTLALAVAIVSISCARIPHTGKVKLKNQTDSVSNALGYMVSKQMIKGLQGPFDTVDVAIMGKLYAKSKVKKEMIDQFKTNFDTISVDMFYAGFFNSISEPKSNIFDEKTGDAYLRGVYQASAMKKEMAKIQASSGNVDAGKAFLAENGKKPGVTTTASGLQYKVIKAGNGKKPAATDKVKVHYTGTLLDGTVFDSSVQRGQPAEFGVSQVIPGWTEGLQLMQVGSKYQFVIPSNLAYGVQGAGEKIAPNSTLIFEVELLEIQ